MTFIHDISLHKEPHTGTGDANVKDSISNDFSNFRSSIGHVTQNCDAMIQLTF
jgi:hypothetical protein